MCVAMNIHTSLHWCLRRLIMLMLSDIVVKRTTTPDRCSVMMLSSEFTVWFFACTVHFVGVISWSGSLRGAQFSVCSYRCDLMFSVIKWQCDKFICKLEYSIWGHSWSNGRGRTLSITADRDLSTVYLVINLFAITFCQARVYLPSLRASRLFG